ncbi:MAG: hypothetical protein M3400_08695 [Actinomycetota bacterium]|nr:hypothetical protein [Actinomycetota bacterium]
MSAYPPADQGGGCGLEGLLRDGDRILLATGPSEPTTLIEELLGVAERRHLSLQLLQVLPGSREQIMAASPRHSIRPIVPGRGAKWHPAHAEVLPMSMMQLARSIASGEMRIDGVLFSGRLIDEARVNLGICIDVVELACDTARFRAVEINEALPLVPSASWIPLERCDYAISTSRAPLAQDKPVTTSPAATAIGEYVATLVPDGSSIELGIGRSVAGVAAALIGHRRSITVHSGLLSDWTQALVENGIADRVLPCTQGAPVVGTVALGSPAFYEWIDEQQSVRLIDSRHAQDPAHLAGLGSFVAINAASRVDCAGQMGAEHGATARMAVGGLLDFAVAGTYGGRSIVALESVDRQGDSRIVPQLSNVQLPASLVTHVVTEYGVAQLGARTWSERKRELIAIAHPDHRAHLRRDLS